MSKFLVISVLYHDVQNDKPCPALSYFLCNTLFLQKIKICSLNYSVTMTFLYILKLDNLKLSQKIIIIGDQLLVNK